MADTETDRCSKAAAAADATTAASSAFTPGEMVILHGLEARPQLNGCMGCVVQFVVAKCRFEVRLLQTLKSLAVKPANLRSYDGDSDAISSDQVPPHTTEFASALRQAAAKGKMSEAVKFLLQGADPDVPDEFDENSVHAAAGHGHDPMVRMLVTKFGASPAVVSSVGVTAVHLAAASGHESTVRLLATELLPSRGGDDDTCSRMCAAAASAVDRDGLTPLHHAATSGHCTVIQLLVSLGADARARDVDGLTAVHCAAANGADNNTLPSLAASVVHSQRTDSHGSECSRCCGAFVWQGTRLRCSCWCPTSASIPARLTRKVKRHSMWPACRATQPLLGHSSASSEQT
jgi:ankyrin repeat protein